MELYAISAIIGLLIAEHIGFYFLCRAPLKAKIGALNDLITSVRADNASLRKGVQKLAHTINERDKILYNSGPVDPDIINGVFDTGDKTDLAP